MNSPSTLTDAQREALLRLSPTLPTDAYLAGGVAVALHHHHRVSHDLDFFVQTSDPAELERDILGLPGTSLVSRAKGTLYLSVGDIPVSILRYTPNLLEATSSMFGLPVPVASVRDLACMKLSAISQRGARRDFWDLHVILQNHSGGLSDLLESFAEKYPKVDVGHVVRSLVYFGDANAEPSPRGLANEEWDAIQKGLVRAVLAL
jgi:hypothetical protein